MVKSRQASPAPQMTLPPGPRSLPVVGNLLSLRIDPLGFLQQVQRTYGDMATLYFGKQPAVLLFRPEHVRYVLVEHPGAFSNRGLLQQNRNAVLASEGLLTIDGEAHRQQRRAVQPAFHKKQVEGYASIIAEFSQEMLSRWQPGEQINLSQAMQELTLRVVSKCLFSIDLANQLGPLGAAFDGLLSNSASSAVEDLLNIRVDHPMTAYGKRMAALRELDRVIYTLIAQRREQDHPGQDVLGLLLSAESGEADGGKLTEKQVHDHLLTFLAAGHETTAIALVWTLYLLARHPQIRIQLQADLAATLAGNMPTIETLAKIPMLDWVLSESMRLYPPAWLQMRTVAQETELDGVVLPVGTLLILSQWVLHRRPDLWTEAEEFRPERWNPANEQAIPSGAYFPFGGGPRTCIGMPLAQLESKMILAMLLQRFSPEPAPEYAPGFQPGITLRPKHPLHVTLLSASPADSQTTATETGRVPELVRREKATRRGCLAALLSLFGFPGTAR